MTGVEALAIGAGIGLAIVFSALALFLEVGLRADSEIQAEAQKRLQEGIALLRADLRQENMNWTGYANLFLERIGKLEEAFKRKPPKRAKPKAVR